MTQPPVETPHTNSLRAATVALFVIAALGLLVSFACAIARLPFAGFVFIGLVVAPAAAAAALMLVSAVGRGEHKRRLIDHDFGRRTVELDAGLLNLLITIGSLAPLALFVLVRIPIGCSVLNLFGLPWPPAVETAAEILSGLIVVTGLAVALVGIWAPPLQSASRALWTMWAGVAPLAWFVFFVSLYGDPGPTTCQ